MADINTVKASTRRVERSRKRLKGTTERPRLAVRVTNKNISAQLVNDQENKTVVTVVGSDKGTMTERATVVGTEIAAAAKKAKIAKVVFDRGSKQYHGRVKAVAEAARKAGLEL